MFTAKFRGFLTRRLKNIANNKGLKRFGGNSTYLPTWHLPRPTNACKLARSSAVCRYHFVYQECTK